MPYDDLVLPDDLVLADGIDRATLLARVGAAQRSDPARPLRLVGHGSSGVAVLSLALHQRRLGLVIGSATCVGADGEDDPVSGAGLGAPVAPPYPTVVRIVPGAGEEWSRRTAATWRAAGWDVR